MTDKAKLAELPAESAESVAGVDRASAQAARIYSLEHTLVKTRDALRVIARGLEGMADEHASADALLLTQDDVSMLYGTISLLGGVADDCDRAFWEGATESA